MALSEIQLDRVQPGYVGNSPNVYPLDPERISEPDFLELITDTETRTRWVWIKGDAPANFRPELVKQLLSFQDRVNRYQDSGIEYQVLGSRIPGVFSLGGDLALFHNLILQQDRQSLTDYAVQCIELVSRNLACRGKSVTTVALVQGGAMGGGLEAALSCDYIVAEESAQMGLPEVLFNMFPGMGAYQLLRRRMTQRDARDFIASGRTYSANELKDRGIVDVVVEDGEGEQATRQLIRTLTRSAHGLKALNQVIDRSEQVDHQELLDCVGIWVDTALALEDRDLQKMSYLIKSQQKRGY